MSYCAIGIYHTKTAVNVGTLWRSANLLGASFIFTIGRRYKRQGSDTMSTWRDIPLFHFDTAEDMKAHLPFSCRLVGIELDARSKPIGTYEHHDRAVYLLGAEDHGLPASILNQCHDLVQLPGRESMNVSVAGSIVLYDRLSKAPKV